MMHWSDDGGCFNLFSAGYVRKVQPRKRNFNQNEDLMESKAVAWAEEATFYNRWDRAAVTYTRLCMGESRSSVTPNPSPLRAKCGLRGLACEKYWDPSRVMCTTDCWDFLLRGGLHCC
jgi:hypothetical protein